MTIVQHCLLCGLHPRARGDVFSGVQVAAESREVAAADMKAQTMPFPEDVTHRAELSADVFQPQATADIGRFSPQHNKDSVAGEQKHSRSPQFWPAPPRSDVLADAAAGIANLIHAIL